MKVINFIKEGCCGGYGSGCEFSNNYGYGIGFLNGSGDCYSYSYGYGSGYSSGDGFGCCEGYGSGMGCAFDGSKGIQKNSDYVSRIIFCEGG